MPVCRGHDDLSQRLGRLHDLQRRQPILILPTCLAKDPEGFRWRNDPAEGIDLHGLDLGNAMQPEMLKSFPRSSFQGC